LNWRLLPSDRWIAGYPDKRTRRKLCLYGKKVKLDFHWADNIQRPDDIIEFSVSGDSAPDRRFNYHFEQK